MILLGVVVVWFDTVVVGRAVVASPIEEGIAWGLALLLVVRPSRPSQYVRSPLLLAPS